MKSGSLSGKRVNWLVQVTVVFEILKFVECKRFCTVCVNKRQ